jgi:UDP-glucose 4-epimerase
MLNKKILITGGKNILITGGAGYIGSHLANYLYKKKNNIFVIDDLSRGKRNRLNKNIYFLKSCISNQNKIRKIINEKKISIIIHLAGKVSAIESQNKKEQYFKINYNYSKKLYETAKNLNVKKFIFASTAAVYGDYKTIFKEIDRTKPINNYGFSKLKFEKYLVKKKKIKHVILRFFNVTGKYYIDSNKFNKNDSVILKLFKTYKKNINKFYISTNKLNQSTKRDFIHIIDLIKIIEKTINLKKNFLTLNCGYGKSISILKIVEGFEKIFKTKFKKIFKVKNESDPFEVIADTTKLNKIFNFKPKYNSNRKVLSKIKSIS